MLNVKNAEIADLEQIMKIYRYAQDYMIKSGNPTQWGHFYPDADLIKSDIDKNACKVIYDKNGIHGVFALFDGTEPTYKHIEGGNWLNEEPYLTIHRLAGDGQVHGLFPCALNYCKKISCDILPSGCISEGCNSYEKRYGKSFFKLQSAYIRGLLQGGRSACFAE